MRVHIGWKSPLGQVGAGLLPAAYAWLILGQEDQILKYRCAALLNIEIRYPLTVLGGAVRQCL
jgi:hypothetical protein